MKKIGIFFKERLTENLHLGKSGSWV